MSVTLTYLKSKEWSIGNGQEVGGGQCPECFGLRPGPFWDNHPLTKAGIMKLGHQNNCNLANSIKEMEENGSLRRRGRR